MRFVVSVLSNYEVEAKDEADANDAVGKALDRAGFCGTDLRVRDIASPVWEIAERKWVGDWCPEHLREAMRRHGSAPTCSFPDRRDAGQPTFVYSSEWATPEAATFHWLTDGSICIRIDGPPPSSERASGVPFEALLAMDEPRVDAIGEVDGNEVRLGCAVFNPSYVALAEESTPGARWMAPTRNDRAAAHRVNDAGEVVVALMPVQRVATRLVGGLPMAAGAS
jgi:hypothetical protein